MAPDTHIAKMQETQEIVAVGERDFSDRPIFAWLALSGVLAGCAVSIAVAKQYDLPDQKEAKIVQEALKAARPRMGR